MGKTKRRPGLLILVAAYLNLIPGFGLGYLLAGRWFLFFASIVGWAIAIVVGIGIAQARSGSACFGCEFYCAVMIAFLALSVPGSLHMLIGWIRSRRPAGRVGGVAGFALGLAVMAVLMRTVEVDVDRLWIWLIILAVPLIGSALGGALVGGRR